MTTKLLESLNDEKSKLNESRRAEANALADLKAAQRESADDANVLLQAEEALGGISNKTDYISAASHRDRVRGACEYSQQLVATTARRFRDATADREAHELAVNVIAEKILDERAEAAAQKYFQAYDSAIKLFDQMAVIARRDLASTVVQDALARIPATRNGDHQTPLPVIRYGVPVGAQRAALLAELLADPERVTEAA